MRRRIRLVAAALVVWGLAAALVWWLGWSVSPPTPDRPQRMALPVRSRFTTAVGYNHTGPPPWPSGNCFWLYPDPTGQAGPRFHVDNMHAENFERLVRDLGLETVEVLCVSPGHCVVVDPRIPREWFRQAPCNHCVQPPLRDQLQERYAEWFSQPKN